MTVRCHAHDLTLGRIALYWGCREAKLPQADWNVHMRGGSLNSCLNAGYDILDRKVGLGVGSEFQRVRAPQAKVL